MFYTEGGETLAQIAQRCGRSHTPGTISGQVVQASEQPAPVADGPAGCQGFGLDEL